jgi:deoxyribodipyrimidine photo-lyase
MPGRSIVIAVLRNDLRIHDNAVLSHALKSDASHVLPVFCFDERQVDLSGLPGYPSTTARTRLCGFWRTGPHRLRFLTETVLELRQSLRDRGSDLLIRFGRPGKIVANLVKALEQQGDSVTEVVLQKEVRHAYLGRGQTLDVASQVTAEEVASERNIDAAARKLTLLHTKPLVHLEELPFKVSKTPDVYTPFRKAVEGLQDKMWRRPLQMPDRFKPFPDSLPDAGDFALSDDHLARDALLGHLLEPLRADGSLDCDAALDLGRSERSAFPLVGGEASAIKRLDHYFFEGGKPPAATYKTTRNGMLGPDPSTKFSSALAVGSLSPRRIMEALGEHESKYGASKDTYWIAFELLWRDFCVSGYRLPWPKLTQTQSTISRRCVRAYPAVRSADSASQKYGNALFYPSGFEGVFDSKSVRSHSSLINSYSPSAGAGQGSRLEHLECPRETGPQAAGLARRSHGRATHRRQHPRAEADRLYVEPVRAGPPSMTTTSL